jgi:hypothetical protein
MAGRFALRLLTLMERNWNADMMIIDGSIRPQNEICREKLSGRLVEEWWQSVGSGPSQQRAQSKI